MARFIHTGAGNPSTVKENPTESVSCTTRRSPSRTAIQERPLSIATGSALRGILSLFLTYKGAFAYRMASGMGDVVFSPIYELLKTRGVKIPVLSPRRPARRRDREGRPSIDAIELTEQARPGGDDYDPFVWVKDFPVLAEHPYVTSDSWTAHELERAAKAGELELEDPNANSPHARAVRLERGRDFEHVVLGIPVASPQAQVTRASSPPRPVCRRPALGPRCCATSAPTPTRRVSGVVTGRPARPRMDNDAAGGVRHLHQPESIPTST